MSVTSYSSASAVVMKVNINRGLIAVLFWLLPIGAYFLFPNYLLLIVQVMILGLFALSLDLLLGYAGVVSLGHAAYFGLGAYTAGILSVNGWGEPISGLGLAMIVSMVAGWLSSFLVVRGQDLTRLMVTLGLALMLFEIANKTVSITGGVDGLWGVSTSPLFGFFEFGLDGKTAFFYSFFVLLGCFLLLKRIVGSTYGLSLIAIREGVTRMPAIGVSVPKRLRSVYTLSAAIAGLAGALMVQTTQFVSLDALSFQRSADVLIMLILGGTGRLYGALVGAAIFVIVQDQISSVNPIYWQFWIGLLLVVIVMVGKGGVFGLYDRFVAKTQASGGKK